MVNERGSESSNPDDSDPPDLIASLGPYRPAPAVDSTLRANTTDSA